MIFFGSFDGREENGRVSLERPAEPRGLRRRSRVATVDSEIERFSAGGFKMAWTDMREALNTANLPKEAPICRLRKRLRCMKLTPVAVECLFKRTFKTLWAYLRAALASNDKNITVNYPKIVYLWVFPAL